MREREIDAAAILVARWPSLPISCHALSRRGARAVAPDPVTMSTMPVSEAVYGAPPLELVEVPPHAVQVSPLSPGADDPEAKLVVAGDVNDFEFSQTTDILAGNGKTAMTDLPRTLPANERYSYVYEGNSQILDHILLSPKLAQPWLGLGKPPFNYDIVHTNSEFPDQDSDHDPQIVRMTVTPF